MKRHLLRFAWLYAILFFLLCIPAVVWTLFYVPPIDESTQLAVARWLDEENERRYGPSIGPEYTETFDKLENSFFKLLYNDNKLWTLLGFKDWNPLIDTFFEQVWGGYKPMIEDIDQVWSQGIFSYPNLDAVQASSGGRPRSEIERYLPNTFFESVRMQLYRLRFHRAVQQKDWSQAQKILDICQSSLVNRSNIDNASTYTGFRDILDLCNVLDSLYLACLDHDVPAEFARQAMLSLRCLRRHCLAPADPYSNLQGICVIDSEYQRDSLQDFVDDPKWALIHQLRVAESLYDLARFVAEKPSLFDEPVMQQRAARLAGTPRGGMNIASCFSTTSISFLRAAARDRGWQENSDLPPGLWQTGDPWTMMFMGVNKLINVRNAGYLNENPQNRIQQVWECLLEAALSTRVYHAQHARWPSSPQELDMDPALQITGWGNHPLQSQWMVLNDDLRGALWDQMLCPSIATRGDHFFVQTRWSTKQSEDVRGLIDMSASPHRWAEELGVDSVQAVQAWLMGQAQAWAAHPELVCSVQVMSADPPSTPSTVEQEEYPPINFSLSSSPTPKKPGQIGRMFGMPGMGMPGMGMPGMGMPGMGMPGMGMPGMNFSARGHIKDSVTTPDLTLAWTPLDAEQVRVDLDNFYDDAWPPAASEDAAGTAPAFVPPRLPGLLRLRAELTAPAQALVIWHPGPDGVDDGGQIVYDPTNGTVSGGDMVIFPQHF